MSERCSRDEKEDKQMEKFYTMFVLLCMITYVIYHRAEAFMYQYSEVQTALINPYLACQIHCWHQSLPTFVDDTTSPIYELVLEVKLAIF